LERIERVSGYAAGAGEVSARLAAVRARIERACAATGRDPEDVAVLAVTKGFGAEAIEAALAAGLNDIGENYLQEAAPKFGQLAWPSGARRHFIGGLQRNKARRVAEIFDVVQTVDRLSAAEALERGAAALGKTLDALIQINVAQDERAGATPAEALELARGLEAFHHLRLRGAMAVGPADASANADAFATAAACFRLLRDRYPDARLLSLGMTADLEAAVAAGSTMVRVGTALFGPRPQEG